MDYFTDYIQQCRHVVTSPALIPHDTPPLVVLNWATHGSEREYSTSIPFQLTLLVAIIAGYLTGMQYREAWRYTGPFTRFNRFKGSFPGLGLATVAFAGYLVYEQVFLEDHSHGHGEGHGSGH